MKSRPHRGRGRKVRRGSEKPPAAQFLNRDARRKAARANALARLEIGGKERRRAIGIIGPTVYDGIVRLKGESTAKNLADALARRVKERELRKKSREAVKTIKDVGVRQYEFETKKRRTGKRYFQRLINSGDVAEYKGTRPTGRIVTGIKARTIIKRQRYEDMVHAVMAVTEMSRMDTVKVIRDVREREKRTIKKFKKTAAYKKLSAKDKRRFTMKAARGKALSSIREYVRDHGWVDSPDPEQFEADKALEDEE